MNYSIHEHAIGSTFETGATFVNAQLDRVKYSKIRKYFDIDDTFLFEKIKLMIFPFYSYSYKDTNGRSVYTPDLYIPLMSIITLVIINSFYFDPLYKFHLDIICLSFTRIIFFKILCACGYKLLTYIFGLDISLTDFIAITGYKFFIIIFIRVLSWSYLIKLILSIYSLVAFFIFLSRSLKDLLEMENIQKKFIYILFGIVFVEVFFLIFMMFK